jgi:hypothetical protein
MPGNYYSRFENAFIKVANEFTAFCVDGTRLPLSLKVAVQAVAMGIACSRRVWLAEKGSGWIRKGGGSRGRICRGEKENGGEGSWSLIDMHKVCIHVV